MREEPVVRLPDLFNHFVEVVDLEDDALVPIFVGRELLRDELELALESIASLECFVPFLTAVVVFKFPNRSDLIRTADMCFNVAGEIVDAVPMPFNKPRNEPGVHFPDL